MSISVHVPGITDVGDLAEELPQTHFDGIAEGHLVEVFGVVWDAGSLAGFSEGGKGVEVHGMPSLGSRDTCGSLPQSLFCGLTHCLLHFKYGFLDLWR